jgi:hypothetical protein
LATENKDFRVKNGLIVEGTSATVNGNDVITSASSISDLSDIDTSGATNSQTLVYNASSGVWMPGTAIGGGEGGGSYTISATAPSSPSAGDVWFDSTDGLSYIYYTDVDTSQWIELSGPQGLIGEGIASGGTTGQILSKASNENYDTQWQDLVLDKAISELTDTSISSPVDGESLVYDGTSWVNEDVSIPYASSEPTPVAGKLWIDSSNSAEPVLKVYNGTDWIPVSGSGGLVNFFLMGA